MKYITNNDFKEFLQLRNNTDFKKNKEKEVNEPEQTFGTENDC